MIGHLGRYRITPPPMVLLPMDWMDWMDWMVSGVVFLDFHILALARIFFARALEVDSGVQKHHPRDQRDHRVHPVWPISLLPPQKLSTLWCGGFISPPPSSASLRLASCSRLVAWQVEVCSCLASVFS